MGLRVIYIPIIAFVVIGVLVQLKIGTSVESAGKLYPVRIWFLLRGADGEVISTLYDYEKGIVQSYEVAQVIRGDIVKFRLNTIGNFIRAGDTVGFIYSNELEYQLARLKGLLDVQKATLKFYMAGEKEAIIEQARRKLEQAREQVEAQRKIFDRAKALYEKNLISAQEFEIALTTLKIYEANVEIAKAELENVKTGAKEEQIELIKANINAIQKEIDVIKKRIESSTLIAPISGVVSGHFSSDTIIAVMDTSASIVIFPVNLPDAYKLKPGHMVNVKSNGEILTAVVKASQNKVEILNGRQVIFFVAVVKDKSQNLRTGTIVNCYANLEKVSLLKLIANFIKRNF